MVIPFVLRGAPSAPSTPSTPAIRPASYSLHPYPVLTGGGRFLGVAQRGRHCWQCRECSRWEPDPFAIGHREWCLTGRYHARLLLDQSKGEDDDGDLAVVD